MKRLETLFRQRGYKARLARACAVTPATVYNWIDQDAMPLPAAMRAELEFDIPLECMVDQETQRRFRMILERRRKRKEKNAQPTIQPDSLPAV